MEYEMIAISLFVGVAIGVVAHYHYVKSIFEDYEREQREAMAERLEEHFKQHVVTVYTERDEDTDVIRMFEAASDRFICQSQTGIGLVEAFAERYPGKQMFIAQTDEDLVLELGLDPDDYDISEEAA